MQFDRHTTSLLRGGAQTENIEVRGARNLEHVQCAYNIMNHQYPAGSGGMLPQGICCLQRGGGGGGG